MHAPGDVSTIARERMKRNTYPVTPTMLLTVTNPVWKAIREHDSCNDANNDHSMKCCCFWSFASPRVRGAMLDFVAREVMPVAVAPAVDTLAKRGLDAAERVRLRAVHLEELLPDARTDVVFVGLPGAGHARAGALAGCAVGRDRGTLGERAGAGDGARWVLGARGSVGAAALAIEGAGPPRGVFVTHGEAEAAESSAVRVSGELGWDARVPAEGESLVL
jgi:hypothetical protein